MTRGRPVTRGLDDAIRIASARGAVSMFRPGPACVFSFMIRTPVRMVFVHVRYVTVLHSPVRDVEQVHRNLITLLRSHAGPGPVTAELWTYNKHGSYRYFRISDAGLIEQDSCGNVPENDIAEKDVLEKEGSGTCKVDEGIADGKVEGAA
jgi:hypothetical protein